MTDDVAPMTKCTVSRRGRHMLSVVLPSDEQGDLTLFCERCGALRRVPVSGRMTVLDEADAAVIRRLVTGS